MKEKYPAVLQSEVDFYENKGYEIKLIRNSKGKDVGFEYHIITLIATCIGLGQATLIQYHKNDTCESLDEVSLTIGMIKQIYQLFDEKTVEYVEKLAGSREEKKDVQITAAADGNGAV